MDVQLSTESRGGATVVSVAGDLDIHSAPSLRATLSTLLEDGQLQLVVDLEKVGFLDSSAIGALVGAHKRAEELGGSLQLVCTQPRTLKVFGISRITDVVPVHATVDEALPGT